MRRTIERTNAIKSTWNRPKNFCGLMYLNLKVNTDKLIIETVRRNTLAKMSSKKDTSILRELKSPSFKNKNFCPLLLITSIRPTDISAKIVKNMLNFLECL